MTFDYELPTDDVAEGWRVQSVPAVERDETRVDSSRAESPDFDIRGCPRRKLVTRAHGEDHRRARESADELRQVHISWK